MTHCDDEWIRLIDGLESSARMYTASGTFGELCAVLAGYDVGAGTDYLMRFGRWIAEKKGAGSVAFDAFIIERACRGRDNLRPPVEKAEDGLASEELFLLLREFCRDDEWWQLSAP